MKKLLALLLLLASFGASAATDALNIKSFGAKCDGVTDDTAAINKAEVAATAVQGGGSVFIPASVKGCVVAGTITATAPTFGEGWGTVLKTSSATADVIQITASSVTLSGFAISTSVTRTGGYYINSIGAYFAKINNVSLSNFFNGIGVTGGATTTTRITDSLLTTNVAGGYGIEIVTAANSVDVVLSNLMILGPTTGSQPLGGVYIANAGDITLDHVSTVHMGGGLLVAPSTGQTVQALFVHDSLFDSGSSTGVNLSPSSTGSIQLAKFVNVWSSTNANGFVLGGNAAGTVLRSEFINCTGSNNTTNGFAINGNTVTGTSVVGGSFSANATGISIAANSLYYSIVGTKVGTTGQFGVNTTGLSVGNGTDNFTIANNDFTGNTTNTSIGTFPGTYAISYTIKDNLGLADPQQAYINEASSRVAGTTYTNSTGRPIFVSAAFTSTTASTASFTVNGITSYGSSVPSTGLVTSVAFVVPVGATYSATASGGTVLSAWIELR